MNAQVPLKASFLTSAARANQFPEDVGAEVAFVGRSNAGKSTALNLLTGCKQLARTSKAPGCTQLINFFALNEQQRLVDLPGYGFAKASKQQQSHWQTFLPQYLLKREILRGLVWLMDIRHPLTPTDQRFLPFIVQRQIPTLILLTKADKISKSDQNQVCLAIEQALQYLPFAHEIVIFSATQKIGIVQAQNWVLAKLEQQLITERA